MMNNIDNNLIKTDAEDDDNDDEKAYNIYHQHDDDGGGGGGRTALDDSIEDNEVDNTIKKMLNITKNYPALMAIANSVDLPASALGNLQGNK